MTDDEDTDPETACERIRNEATPLITDRRSLKATCTSRIWWTCLFSPYEPMTPKFRAEIPSPLMLLALGMGVTIIEACGILGSYTVLLANAQSVFPQCGKYKILDRVFGMTTQVGWMCEISSLFLFTFPLVCTAFLPFLSYWEFCAARLYYECLRSRMMLEIPDKPFFTSVFFGFTLLYFIVGMTSILFTGAQEGLQWNNFKRSLMPFLMPIGSFVVSVYASWDVRFFLVSLPNFTKSDYRWAQSWLSACTHIHYLDLRDAYITLHTNGKLDHLELSEQVFDALREEIERASQLTPATKSASTKKMLHYQESRTGKTAALLCGKNGHWETDLLWIPMDMRATHFRIMFRVFAAGAYILLLGVLWLIVGTIILYLHLQGHLTKEQMGYFKGFAQMVIKTTPP